MARVGPQRHRKKKSELKFMAVLYTAVIRFRLLHQRLCYTTFTLFTHIAIARHDDRYVHESRIILLTATGIWVRAVVGRVY